jgi:hypothetical protein
MDLADRVGICGNHRGCVQSFRLTTTASQLLSGITLAFGNQQVTVKHIHQQVNVTDGGQAVVAGDTVTRGQGERRPGMIEK